MGTDNIKTLRNMLGMDHTEHAGDGSVVLFFFF